MVTIPISNGKRIFAASVEYICCICQEGNFQRIDEQSQYKAWRYMTTDSETNFRKITKKFSKNWGGEEILKKRQNVR